VLFRGVPRQHPDGTTMTDDTGSPIYGQPVHVDIAITKAALASQAVGPIVNDVEMSYLGRAFPNVACKLLPAKVLAHQTIDPDDSVLGRWKRQGLIGPGGTLNYGELIRLAFRREWWDGGKCPPEQAAGTQPSDGAGITSVSPDDCSCGENVVPLILLADDNDPTNLPYGTLMQANFSLYWGLSIMIFESSLVSNQSPFDGMMQGNPTLVEARWQKEKSNLGTIRLDRSTQNDTPPPEHQTGTAVFQHGFRVFMNRGCVECHSGPLFSELYERQPEDEKLPIYEQLSHTLLPNSRSDSIGYRRDLFHEQVISQIAELLQREGELSSHATRELADSFDLLRELAQGSVADLQVRIEAHLQPLGMTHLAADIASMLMTFEKSAHRYFGDRHFFNEDERIEMAEQLTEPVLVEKMPIPLRVAPLRPRLPIAGPLATEDYAFYDLAFYAIGVSPARYDPGVGDFEPPVLRREQLAEQALTDINAQTDATGALPDSPEKNLRLQSLESIRNELQAYRDQAPNLDRQLSQPTVEVLRKVTQRTMAQKPSIGAPGQAYRLRSTPQLRRTDLEAVSDQSGRTCELGPTTSPDAEFWDLPAPADFTWSRNHLPEDHRRSELAFRSRARTLVSDEEPWGFRKPLLHDNELAFWGSFQTPSLRNVELTAPYMHNGRIRHLGDVIDFYDRGGDILTDKTLYPDKHPQIGDALSDEDILDLSENDKLALRFFLLCLTDERVRLEQGPFDHPSLRLVHGYDQNLNERVAVVAAVGNKGWTDSSGNAVLNKIPQLFPELE
ncbi:MAG: hypothetical protein KDA52_16840, partial [Planctomycetaceae bacterium]|nr:hypothetical protein [Planctomycetaceae bacterium]